MKLPIEWLKDINLIDTPGLNSLHADHQQRTTEFIPRSDIIFFLTSVSQVLSKSEKKFLDYIRKWNKKAVIILSKKDLVNNDDLEKIEKYLKSHFEKEFGYVPVVIPTSSKHFFDSLEERDPERGQQLYNQSGIPELKNYINNTLTSSERIKMKFKNALHISDMMLNKYGESCEKEIKNMDSKMIDINKMDETSKQYIDQMKSYIQFNNSDLQRILDDAKMKTIGLIDEYVRISNFMIIFNKNKFAEKFKTEIGDSLNSDLESKVNYMVDHFAEKNEYFFQKVKDDLAEKFSTIEGLDYKNQIEKHREIILQKTIRDLTNKENKLNFATKISEEVRTAYWNTLAFELTTIFGIGAASYLSTLALPIEPILIPTIGIVIGAGGLGLLPYKRKQLKKRIHIKTEEVSEKLSSILSGHFENEINKHLSRIEGIMSPHKKILKENRKNVAWILDDINLEKETVEQIKKEVHKI